jgi:hypothetical protein
MPACPRRVIYEPRLASDATGQRQGCPRAYRIPVLRSYRIPVLRSYRIPVLRFAHCGRSGQRRVRRAPADIQPSCVARQSASPVLRKHDEIGVILQRFVIREKRSRDILRYFVRAYVAERCIPRPPGPRQSRRSAGVGPTGRKPRSVGSTTGAGRGSSSKSVYRNRSVISIPIYRFRLPPQQQDSRQGR